MMRLENGRASHIHYRVIGGRGIYWASDVEPREV